MAIDAVKNNTPKKKTNCFNSTVIGGVTGYALKWIIPITKSEKDKSYLDELSLINMNSKKVRLEEIESIKKNLHKIPGADTFIKLNEQSKLCYREINKLNFPLRDNVEELFDRVNKAASEFKIEGERFLKLKTKDIRPTRAFIALGAAIGLFTALIRNVSKEIKKNAIELDS